MSERLDITKNVEMLLAGVVNGNRLSLPQQRNVLMSFKLLCSLLEKAEQDQAAIRHAALTEAAEMLDCAGGSEKVRGAFRNMAAAILSLRDGGA